MLDFSQSMAELSLDFVKYMLWLFLEYGQTSQQSKHFKSLKNSITYIPYEKLKVALWRGKMTNTLKVLDRKIYIFHIAYYR